MLAIVVVSLALACGAFLGFVLVTYLGIEDWGALIVVSIIAFLFLDVVGCEGYMENGLIREVETEEVETEEVETEGMHEQAKSTAELSEIETGVDVKTTTAEEFYLSCIRECRTEACYSGCSDALRFLYSPDPTSTPLQP